MRKWIKYTLLVAIIAFVGYNSIYFKKLSDVKSAAKAASFDAAAYARNFLDKTLPANKDKAIDLPYLSQLLTSDPHKAFSLSHAQNNGNNRFFMVKGEGQITRIDSENVYLNVAGVSPKVLLAIEYIIGTAARDGSGLISVDEFNTTMEMNTVSEEINKLIKTKVLPPFKSAAKTGATVSFTGCIELQQDKAVPDSLEVIPLILTL